MLRGRPRVRPGPLDAAADRSTVPAPLTPEDRAVLADSLGEALLVVLDVLSPAERIAFVLHDVFSLPFDEIGAILGKSAQACRQLASRARRRVRLAQDPTADPRRQREVVGAFLAAATSGDFAALAVPPRPGRRTGGRSGGRGHGGTAGAHRTGRGRRVFSGRAEGARLALLDGLAGLVWAQGGTTRVAFDFTVVSGRVTRIEMTAEPDVLDDVTVEFLPRPRRR